MERVDVRYHSIVVLDVERFGRRPDQAQAWVRGRLYEMLRAAVASLGLPRSEVATSDRGDGAIVLLPASLPPASLFDPFLRLLEAAVGEHNRVAGDDGAIRLRVAFHTGGVARDAEGYLGTALNTACRLVDLPALRDCLRRARRAQLALIVSDEMVARATGPDPHIGEPTFLPVQVRVKELRSQAWIHVPGYGRPPCADPVCAPPSARVARTRARTRPPTRARRVTHAPSRAR